MSKRKYTIRRDAGEHLTEKMRETLGIAWNRYVNNCSRISLRQFAKLHNVPYETWRRELNRGAVSPILRRGNRWTYPEYDIDKARASINEGKAETYYTRTYASYEKGAVENCNRLVRRWYPKGTDFNQLTRRQLRRLEDWINTIHRESLNGETAYAYDSRLAKAA